MKGTQLAKRHSLATKALIVLILLCILVLNMQKRTLVTSRVLFLVKSCKNAVLREGSFKYLLL